ncbi:MAG TPA: (Fe-S)-binding protein [Acidimicrobiia bacterium]|nr:(Fe-S)-binding protein [Acidimicrobiia bacterium]
MNVGGGPLGLDDDELVSCVACGLCLPHCPTYRVTGQEIASPRGRIAAMRLVESGGAPIDDAFVAAMHECVQCRGCEAACPSSVPFGHLMESTRAALHGARSPATRAHRVRRAVEAVAYRVVLPRHRVLLAFTWGLVVAQRLRLVPRRFGVPRLDARALATRLDLPVGERGDGGATVWLFTGCVMDAWQRDTHRNAARVLARLGARPVRPARGADCCGALHLHAGRRDDARRLALRVMRSMPGDAPIVVDSAGCGAALAAYGDLLGTPDARVFATRVVDFSTYVARHPPVAVRATGSSVVVQDPCHLRHVQRAHGAVREILGAAYELRETDDDGLCCGAGGAYSALEPELASDIRVRKIAALRRAGGPNPVIASANPGCTFHLRAAGIDARHPADLLADALVADPPVTDPGAPRA